MNNTKTYYALNERTLVKPEMEEPKPGSNYPDAMRTLIDWALFENNKIAWEAHLESLKPGIEIEGPDIVPGTWYREDEWRIGDRYGGWSAYLKGVSKQVAIPVTPVQQGEEDVCEHCGTPWYKEHGGKQFGCSSCGKFNEKNLEQVNEKLADTISGTKAFNQATEIIKEVVEWSKDKPQAFVSLSEKRKHTALMRIVDKAQLFIEQYPPTKVSTYQIIEALCWMWEQYCPPPDTHMCMSAGEQTEDVLAALGLLNPDDTINWEKVKELKISEQTATGDDSSNDAGK
jgi:uncharacterized Zn finger protein (UPF0148 family)